MLDGLIAALGPGYLFFGLVGVVLGILVGALPGLTATMGTALLLPFTFNMPPGQGLAMLGGLYVAAMFADAVPACLVNTPGTPSALATSFDGNPLTRQGKGQVALVAASFSSMIGTIVGALVFLFLTPPLATAALEFGPPEFFWLGVFALTIIAGIAGDSILKGLAGGAMGMLIATIGLSATGGTSRYTFGFPELYGGVELVVALIGIFAMPQVFTMVRRRRQEATVGQYQRVPGAAVATVKEILRKPVNLIRSSLLGAGIGVLPGAGGPVAALVSYNEAMRWSKDRQKFGKGAVEGVVASETANNGGAGASMVPMLALGVPGSAPAAVILGALMLQGLRPGPELMERDSTLVHGFAFSILIAGIFTFVVGSLVAGQLARVVTIPVHLLAPIVFLLSVVGAFAIRSNLSDVYLMLGLGLIVYFLMNLGFHQGAIGLGVILGPIVEPALVQSISIARSSSYVEVFFTRPVSIGLIVLILLSVAWSVWSKQKERSRAST
ncbi:C4-dicarboxylate ABC transporter permease [Actinobacteria bacterium YIM 96077]|uniref:C4-dicarboxylate ABC transporter permease n=1 Tax=Phytoactinopolyspora halophila TaxID=1981511 RepID=A0A329R0H9_9ACTN|nr:tripartite tricarboxylate transporter permease [Phytoactinopolyspora halophila]AYY11704.1 C4-dicarboxylate ABC transporter permease [Actinobacteria bacterium YIM 96077]RAW17863.1 C4-dicarboxylate ABC transporter permease [Phytoactinopolyspora halophila]